jgi:phage-related protein
VTVVADVIGHAVVQVTTDGSRVATGASTSGKTAGSSFRSGFVSSMKGLAAAAGITAIGATVTKVLKDSIAEAREAQKVGAATEQQIKSTGGVANVTAKEISNLAQAISMKVGVDDEEIQAGQNMLLMFTNIRNEAGKGNDIFNQATQIMVDLAAKTGSETGAAKMLGKALNDPARGMAGLTRAGVQFTAAETERIKKMAESGHLMEAQKEILKALQDRVGGLAESQATAGEKMSVVWKNLEEQIGMALLPLLDKVETWAATVVMPNISEFITQMQTGAGAGGDFADALESLWGIVQGLWGVIEPLLFDVLIPFGEWLANHPAVVYTAVAAWAAFKTALIVHDIIAATSAAITLLSAALLGEAGAAGVAATATWALDAALAVLTAPITIIIAAIALVIAALVTMYLKVGWFHDGVNAAFQGIWNAAKAVFEALRTFIPAAFNWAVDQVKNTLRNFVALVRGDFSTAKAIITTILGAIRAVVVGAWRAIDDAVKSALNAIKGAVVGGWNAVRNATVTSVNAIRGAAASGFNAVKNAVLSAMHAAQAGLQAAWNAMVGAARGGANAVVGAVSSIIGRIGALVGRAAGIGASIGHAIINGLRSALSFAGGIVGAVKSAVNSALGLPIHIHGPGPLPDITIPAFAKGTVVTDPTLAWLGERGPELVVPLSPAAGIDTRVLAALERLVGKNDTAPSTPTINVLLPTGDPEAAAMSVMNRLVGAGV